MCIYIHAPISIHEKMKPIVDRRMHMNVDVRAYTSIWIRAKQHIYVSVNFILNQRAFHHGLELNVYIGSIDWE